MFVNKENNLYKYTFQDENNVESELEILLSFKSKKYQKTFFVMTDNVLGENNKLNTYAFYITNKENKNSDDVFLPVTDNDELEYINEVFNISMGV